MAPYRSLKVPAGHGLGAPDLARQKLPGGHIVRVPFLQYTPATQSSLVVEVGHSAPSGQVPCAPEPAGQ